MVEKMESPNGNDFSNGKRNNDPWIPLPEDTGQPLQPSIPSAPQNPLHQLIDSERYIQSLEKKLEKLTKAKRKEPSSRDIISSLVSFHDDQMRRYVDDSVVSDLASSSIKDDDVPSNPSYVQRKLHPERQPLNAEELAELVKEDVMAKTFVDSGLADCAASSSWNSGNKSQKSATSTHECDKKLAASVSESYNGTEPNSSSSSENQPVQNNMKSESEEGWANFDEMSEQNSS